MFGITNLALYLTSVIAVILVPGPNSIFCLTVAAKQGTKRAYFAIAGIIFGDGVLMLLTSLGIATLLKTHLILFLILKTCGALYLGYLGVNILIESYHQFKIRNLAHGTNVKRTIAVQHPFYKALSLSLTNPKAIMFFLAFFPAFVDQNYPNPTISFLMLALILEIVSFSYLSVLVFLGVHLTSWFGEHKNIKLIGITAVGILFLTFGASLLLFSIT